ncbi:MAG TPA: enoyl-CoA hydratase/isomerase family protein [Solirubrobacteraceae bacterium]|nr:enoyl-CoA hydratase/isomerase family protein [Solirubrobacteraceae bacterium]
MTVGIDVMELAPSELVSPLPPWELGVKPGAVGVAIIDGSAADWRMLGAERPALADELRQAPVITVGVVRDAANGEPIGGLVGGCDLVLTQEGPPGGGPDTLEERIQVLLKSLTGAGATALVAAQVLRAPVSSVAAESFAYSMLLGSEAFRGWRAASAPRPSSDGNGDGERVSVERAGTGWKLTLTRPHKHNAFDARMREQLCDALDAIAAALPAPVVLLGAGRSFCSGGDLDEFGTAPSPVAAHLVRTGRSVARRLARLGPRIVAGVHGLCIGAGVEFAAFAAIVIAAPDATFRLPELSLGLGLGAGGTASIPARIGRHRTLELLLRAQPIDAPTALEWGLVDEVVAAEADLVGRCFDAAEGLV